MNLNLREGTITQVTSDLIYLCKSHRMMEKLLRLYFKDELENNESQRRKNKLNQILNDELRIINNFSIIYTKDRKNVIEGIQQKEKNQKVLLPQDILSKKQPIVQGQQNEYFSGLINVLDKCLANIIVLGRPSQYHNSTSKTKRNLGIDLCIESYYIFFQDIPNYFLLPENTKEEWINKIPVLKSEELKNLAIEEVITYSDDFNLDEKINYIFTKHTLKGFWSYLEYQIQEYPKKERIEKMDISSVLIPIIIEATKFLFNEADKFIKPGRPKEEGSTPDNKDKLFTQKDFEEVEVNNNKLLQYINRQLAADSEQDIINTLDKIKIHKKNINKLEVRKANLGTLTSDVSLDNSIDLENEQLNSESKKLMDLLEKIYNRKIIL